MRDRHCRFTWNQCLLPLVSSVPPEVRSIWYIFMCLGCSVIYDRCLVFKKTDCHDKTFYIYFFKYVYYWKWRFMIATTMGQLFFEIYRSGLYRARRVSTCLRYDFPYYKMTTTHREGIQYSPNEDALGSFVGWALGTVVST
jgi:hypothetical protein